MAQFKPPPPFNFVSPHEWSQWRQRFLTFRTATKLHKDDGDVQVSALVYAMGPEADSIMKTFVFAFAAAAVDFDTVLTKFDNYFIPKRNVIFDRAKFNSRSQNPSETVECFLRSLYELSEFCEFGNRKEESIRDRFVIGISDKRVSEKMQLEAELTLSRAVQMARNSEMVKAQNLDHANVDSMVQRETSKACSRCGFVKHLSNTCPAIKAKCRKCKSLGHYEKCCRSKASGQKTKNSNGWSSGSSQRRVPSKSQEEVTENIIDDNNDCSFLGSIDSNTTAWYKVLKVNNVPVKFKLDTGADVTIMPLKHCNIRNVKLSQSQKKLMGPGNAAIKVSSQFEG